MLVEVVAAVAAVGIEAEIVSEVVEIGFAVVEVVGIVVDFSGSVGT